MNSVKPSIKFFTCDMRFWHSDCTLYMLYVILDKLIEEFFKC